MANHNRASHNTIESTERMRQALELRKAGLGFQQIADKLGYKDHSGAYRAVRTALKRTLQEPADEVRRMELERLDKLQTALWSAAIQGKWLAIDRILSIMDRRASLLGLDAPVKIDIEHRIRQIAEETGLDPEEAVREARRVLAAAR